MDPMLPLSIVSGSRLAMTSSSNLPGFIDEVVSASSSSADWDLRAVGVVVVPIFFAAPKMLVDLDASLSGAEDRCQ